MKGRPAEIACASDLDLWVSLRQQIVRDQCRMLWLIATGAALAGPQIAIAQAQAQALVRIERPARASRDDWSLQSRTQRREVLVKDEGGDPVRLRLTEYQ
jgi:hypothetical protein